MKKKIAGIILLVIGVLALAYGGFTYTKDEHAVDFGPVEFSFKEQERVNVPMWAGVATLAVGATLMVLPTRRER